MLGLMAFSIRASDSPSGRMGYRVPLVLADLALMQVVEGLTPHLPYWTLMVSCPPPHVISPFLSRCACRKLATKKQKGRLYA